MLKNISTSIKYVQKYLSNLIRKDKYIYIYIFTLYYNNNHFIKYIIIKILLIRFLILSIIDL